MLKSVFTLSFALLLLVSCSNSDSQEKHKALVHEGMSALELRKVLGEPIKVEDKSKIFDAQSMTKISLEHWVYEKRVVLLINDTVKNPNLN